MAIKDFLAITDKLKVKNLNSGWRGQLNTASFRNVPFHVSSSDSSFGRRNIVHQYPFRAVPYVEDIGMDAQEFTINGYVISNKDNNYNYFSNRDKLITALQQEGSGKLVHPYLGEKTVSLVGKARVSETSDEGGVARFTMTFVISGVNRYASMKIDAVSSIDMQAINTENAMIDSMGIKYNVSNLPGSSIAKLANTVRKCYAIQRKIMAAIQGGPRSLISGALGYIDSAAANLFDSTMASACGIAGNILSSFNAFKNIGGIVGDLQANLITGICSNVVIKRPTGVNKSTTAKPNQIDQELGMSMIIQMASFIALKNAVNLPLVYSPTTARESVNQELILNLAVNLGISATTQVAGRVTYKSQDDAVLAMSLINDVIDTQLDSMGDNVNYNSYIKYGIDIQDDESYLAMQDLRRVFTESMQGLATNLPQMLDYNVNYGVTPAIVLAYNKYKDINRESDIIDRNKILIQHPGFLPGGNTIKILSY